MSRAVWSNMSSKLQAMGGVPQVFIGEPKGPPQDGAVAIIPTSGRVDETTLNTRREVHIVTLRRYANMLGESPEDIEIRMDSWRDQILDDIDGDFDLGGTIAYPHPTETQWSYGYQTIGPEGKGSAYRILDLVIGYRVDPTAEYAA